jgi:hypothetical protein
MNRWKTAGTCLLCAFIFPLAVHGLSAADISVTKMIGEAASAANDPSIANLVSGTRGLGSIALLPIRDTRPPNENNAIVFFRSLDYDKPFSTMPGEKGFDDSIRESIMSRFRGYGIDMKEADQPELENGESATADYRLDVELQLFTVGYEDLQNNFLLPPKHRPHFFCTYQVSLVRTRDNKQMYRSPILVSATGKLAKGKVDWQGDVETLASSFLCKANDELVRNALIGISGNHPEPGNFLQTQVYANADFVFNEMSRPSVLSVCITGSEIGIGTIFGIAGIGAGITSPTDAPLLSGTFAGIGAGCITAGISDIVSNRMAQGCIDEYLSIPTITRDDIARRIEAYGKTIGKVAAIYRTNRIISGTVWCAVGGAFLVLNNLAYSTENPELEKNDAYCALALGAGLLNLLIESRAEKMNQQLRSEL